MFLCVAYACCVPGAQGGIGSLGVGVTGTCEHPDMGSGTMSPLQEQGVLVTTEPPVRRLTDRILLCSSSWPLNSQSSCPNLTSA